MVQGFHNYIIMLNVFSSLSRGGVVGVGRMGRGWESEGSWESDWPSKLPCPDAKRHDCLSRKTCPAGSIIHSEKYQPHSEAGPAVTIRRSEGYNSDKSTLALPLQKALIPRHNIT